MKILHTNILVDDLISKKHLAEGGHISTIQLFFSTVLDQKKIKHYLKELHLYWCWKKRESGEGDELEPQSLSET